jgi:hypothetical protein
VAEQALITKPRGKLPLWLVLTLAIVAPLVIAVLGFLLWYGSRRDLEAADAAARAAGLPVTWAECKLTIAPPAVLTALNRLDMLAGKPWAWQGCSIGSGMYTKWSFGEAIPEAMRAHHDSLPGSEVREAIDLIDALPDAVPIRRVRIDEKTSLPELTTFKNLANWQTERVLLADRDAVAAETLRSVHIARCLPGSDVLFTCMVRSSIARIVARSISARLPDLQGNTLLATELRRCATELWANHTAFCANELVYCRSALENWRLWASPFPRFFAPFLIRCGRAAVLQDAREWCIVAHSETDPQTLVAAVKTFDAKLKSLSLRNPTQALVKEVGWMRFTLVKNMLSARMWLLVLAAELDGSPWPDDDFAPPGTPLRRVERDGHLVFAYSVGENGIDDGGAKTLDVCFPLYGPVEAQPSSTGK